jgi:tripartite-type tricarboxylate transporter receptor subunit TctC
MKGRSAITRVPAILAGALLAGLVHAQTYPTKPIRLVVPFAPGGTSEVVARSVAAEMSKGLGQQMIVDNRAGGAGYRDQSRAPNPRRPLILGHIGTLAVNPYMFPKLPYDGRGLCR